MGKNGALFFGCYLLILSNVLSQSLAISGITEVKSLKRGKMYSIRWSGGERDGKISIELFRQKESVQSWDGILNDGETTVKLGSRLKPGKGYSLRIMESGSDREISSTELTLRRRIPLALKLAPLAVVPMVFLLVKPDEPKWKMHHHFLPPTSRRGNVETIEFLIAFANGNPKTSAGIGLGGSYSHIPSGQNNVALRSHIRKVDFNASIKLDQTRVGDGSFVGKFF